MPLKWLNGQGHSQIPLQTPRDWVRQPVFPGQAWEYGVQTLRNFYFAKM